MEIDSTATAGRMDFMNVVILGIKEVGRQWMSIGRIDWMFGRRELVKLRRSDLAARTSPSKSPETCCTHNSFAFDRSSKLVLYVGVIP